MMLLVLSARPELEANQRLVAAAGRQQMSVRVVDATRVQAVSGPGRGLWCGGENLLDAPPSCVLARVGNWRPESLLALLEAAEDAGVPTPNPAHAMRVGRDHWQTVRVLERAGLPVPTTMVGAEPESLAESAVDGLGLPVVVKVRQSRMGVGVMLCERRDHLESVLDSLWRAGNELVVQRFVQTDGCSLRLLVTGTEICAAARFRAVHDEWRSNAARGAVAEAWKPSAPESELAVAAAEAVGLGVCGIDLLPTPDGPVVGEVNPTPGFSHLERVTGADVAGAIISAITALIGDR